MVALPSISPITVTKRPFNAETPAEALHDNITPNNSFYVRNHFAVPTIDLSKWRLRITGAVKNDLVLSLRDIMTMRPKRVAVTLECAGNSRTRMQPVPAGTPWRDGAVGTAWWTGAPLRELLKKAVPIDRAIEVLFTGADRGTEDGQRLSFQRSLPLREAFNEDVILAYRMNGRPLPRIHGFPIRVIVPRCYGVASVKWLTKIEVLAEPFRGWFQTEQYVYSDAGKQHVEPVSQMRVKSLIVEPREDAVLRHGRSYAVSGLAWSGFGEVTKVEVRFNDSHWRTANLLNDDLGPYAWRRWSIDWAPPKSGAYWLMSRAFDSSKNVQPLTPVWNLYGYAYDTVTPRKVLAI